jgi:hypothetical protein
MNHCETYCAGRILEKNVGYYLAYRVHNPYDVRPDLPKKVAKMAQYLNLEFKAEIEGEQWQMLLKLCQGLASMIPSPYEFTNLHNLLYNNYKVDLYRSSRAELQLQTLKQEFSKKKIRPSQL